MRKKPRAGMRALHELSRERKPNSHSRAAYDSDSSAAAPFRFFLSISQVSARVI